MTKTSKKTLKQRFDVYISGLEDKFFEKEFSIQKVRNYFKDYVIEENAFEFIHKCFRSSLEYLEQTQKVNLSHIQNFNVYRIEEYMILDMATRRNLELTETMREKEQKRLPSLGFGQNHDLHGRKNPEKNGLNSPL